MSASLAAPRAAMALAALVGAIVAIAGHDWSFFVGTSPVWAYPGSDLAAYLSAHAYFVHDQWRLPLFSLPMLGYPDGSSVIYCDAIPLLAAIAKIWYALTGRAVNLFGVWVLAAYALQGVFAARLVYALGERSLWLAVCIASWSVLTLAFLVRWFHFALLGQFLILWALALHFEQTRDRRARVVESIALLVIAVLVNAYITGMAGIVVAASWLTLWRGRVLAWRDARDIAIGLAGLLLVMAIGGYFSVPENTTALGVYQFGDWAWNLAGMVVSPSPLAQSLGLHRHFLPGQYEGESYLGVGPIGIALVCLLTKPGAVWRGIKTHWILTAAILACAAFAASNRVYFGSTLLVYVPLPDAVIRLAAVFRTHGRFVWPLVFVLTLAPAVCLLRERRAWAVAMVMAATVLQAVEAVPVLRWGRSLSTQHNTARLDIPQMTRWLAKHERLWQYPSLYCGVLHPVVESYATVEARQQQLQVIAAQLDVPINSAYLARPLKDCVREADWARRPAFEPGVLYLFIKDVPYFMPATRALISPSHCRDIEWATACSLQPLD